MHFQRFSRVSHVQNIPILLLLLALYAEICVAAKSGIDDCLLISLNLFWMSFYTGDSAFFALTLYFALVPVSRQLVKSESFLPLFPGIAFKISIGDGL